MPKVDEVSTATAANAWAVITTKVGTPEGHACVIAARRAVGEEDPAKLVPEYKRLRAEGTYSHLNSLPMTAGQIAELAIVVNGGKQGVNAHRLDGNARKHLAAHQLIGVRPGSRYLVTDWRATVLATLRGTAVVRAAQGRPVELSTEEAVPLAVIERAMGGPDGGAASWPGSDLALRVAQMWRLVEYTRVPPPPSQSRSPTLGKTIYRLTDEGRSALERHRQAARGNVDPRLRPVIGPHAAEVLEFVGRLRNGDPGVCPPRPMVLQRLIDQGLIVEGTTIPGTSRMRLALTEEGRDALGEWNFRLHAKAQSSELPTVPVVELAPGMWVRISNRRPFPGLGPQWVKVEDVRHVARSDGERLAHNYEVWVTTDAVNVPYLYGGRALFRTVRFQRRHL
jgi:DNA-binding PadR family transcriptional regulator